MASAIGDVRDAERPARALAGTAPRSCSTWPRSALVRPSYAAPAETYAVNVMGTVNLLDAARACESVRVTVVVTSDK